MVELLMTDRFFSLLSAVFFSASSSELRPWCAKSRCSFLTVVDVLVVLFIDMVVHSMEARRRGGLAGAGGGL